MLRVCSKAGKDRYFLAAMDGVLGGHSGIVPTICCLFVSSHWPLAAVNKPGLCVWKVLPSCAISSPCSHTPPLSSFSPLLLAAILPAPGEGLGPSFSGSTLYSLPFICYWVTSPSFPRLPIALASALQLSFPRKKRETLFAHMIPLSAAWSFYTAAYPGLLL
jgi:hypothetical protein